MSIPQKSTQPSIENLLSSTCASTNTGKFPTNDHKFQHLFIQSAPLSAAITPPDRPYSCTVTACKWSFARRSDLKRHLRSHKEPGFKCPFYKNDPTCHRNGGAFNRSDVLNRHLKLVHFIPIHASCRSRSRRKPTQKRQLERLEDGGWCRVCQLFCHSANQFVDHCQQCADNNYNSNQ